MPVLAAPDAAMMQKLVERMEKLEARNAELEKQVKSLKNESDEIAKGLDNPRLSQYEPELTVRLKAVEKDALEMKKSASLADKLDGIVVDAALTTIAQGEGLNGALGNLGLFANAPNSVAFRASGANADDSVAILGEAWYQAAIPLPIGGFTPYSRETLELTFGKMDLFGFFDQNELAGDESVQFLNSVFVHNPLLDAGAEAAVDANGFQPGFVASYLNERDGAEPWRLSLGVFGAGERGANYQKSLAAPLVIAQAEKQVKMFGGLSGNYRAYAWTRSKAASALDSSVNARHTGFGLSVDQQVGDGVKLFGRYGQLVDGDLPFNKALSVGAEISGNYWGRGADAIGIGGSWLKSSSAYRAAGGSSCAGGFDNDAACISGEVNFTPSGAEKVAEIYYRFRVSPQFEITPDFQWIGNGGANPKAKDVKVLGLRANIAY